MATTTAQIHKLTLDDVYAMVRAGVLDDDDRVELIDGVLVDMQPIGATHIGAVAFLNRHIVMATEGLDVHIQAQLNVEGGFVSPDVLVCVRPERPEVPETGLLVIEVAYSSRARDEEKAATYARAGIPEYWIADVDAGEVIVQRAPIDGRYTKRERHGAGEQVQPLLTQIPPIDVTALVGREA